MAQSHPAQTYKELSDHERYGDEADESLMGRHGTPWGERDGNVTSRPGLCAAMRRWGWLLDTALLLVILGLLLERQGAASQRCQPFEDAGDITGFAPTSTKS